MGDDTKELALWRLDLSADVQATACAILTEELEQLAEAVERRLGQLSGDPAGDASAAIRLLNVYTNGLADQRLEKASRVLDSDVTVDEKLWKIDELMPIPPISAAKLGKLFTSKEKPEGVSKTAIQNTSWYKEKHKGRKDAEIDQREASLRQRGKTYERDANLGDDE